MMQTVLNVLRDAGSDNTSTDVADDEDPFLENDAQELHDVSTGAASQEAPLPPRKARAKQEAPDPDDEEMLADDREERDYDPSLAHAMAISMPWLVPTPHVHVTYMGRRKTPAVWHTAHTYLVDTTLHARSPAILAQALAEYGEADARTDDEIRYANAQRLRLRVFTHTVKKSPWYPTPAQAPQAPSREAAPLQARAAGAEGASRDAAPPVPNPQGDALRWRLYTRRDSSFCQSVLAALAAAGLPNPLECPPMDTYAVPLSIVVMLCGACPSFQAEDGYEQGAAWITLPLWALACSTKPRSMGAASRGKKK
jgi:hypothetical protein